MADLQSETFCELIAADRSHAPIQLVDGEPLLIGRGPLTLITDKKVSRNHVEVIAKFSSKELMIKQLGANPSRVAGRELSKNESTILGPMGRFQLVQGKYTYNVHFGQRVPESVLQELRKGADDVNGSKVDISDKEDLCDDRLEVRTKKRKRDSSVRGGSLEDDNDDDPISKGSPQKKSKLDNSDPMASASKSSKPHQTSLTAFLKQGSSTDSDATAKPMEPCWEEKGSLLILRFGESPNSDKIASYDLDSTIIETASGRKFAQNWSDWKFMANVIDKLRSLHSQGYKIVIFSNQLGISKGKPSKGDFKVKAEAIARAVKIPLLLLAATSKDMYRKPCVAMWDHMVKYENGGVVIDLKESFYVGDAAGREANWRHGAKKDFSCTDRKFAANLTISFLTPEEHFHNCIKCSKYSWGEFDPRTLDYSQTRPRLEPSGAKLKSDSQEVVIFVGCPASGKSTFFSKYMKSNGYVHVNRDTLGSWQKCVSECAKALSSGKSVVVDNTSPDKESRLRYIEVARKHKVAVRGFRFMTSIAHAKHNNRFRELTAKSSKHYVKVNDIVFNTYKSKFCEPEIAEGFSEIVKIHFTPSFDSDQHAQLYRSFLD